PLLDQFVHEMRGRFRPQVIVDLWDRINDVGPAEDARHIADVVRTLGGGRRAGSGPARRPRRGQPGRPDGDGAPRAEGEYESVDHDGVHLVLLNSQDPMRPGGGGPLSEAQLDWLAADLRAASPPVLVDSHHPVDERDESEHWYFPTHPGCALAENRERARA